MPECQNIKKGGLDQYGPEHFGRLIFATVRKSMGLKVLKKIDCNNIYLSLAEVRVVLSKTNTE